ncbi:hypothetical protein [Chrysiogenes arsenatis]|uniref:hypothetical protein n=1 Tax=Chrysiogenes arsenatis TaxID=309797 RepID=UPI00041D8923|nr:hypothetical protein [Chrysiogenes arsenatis]
MSIERAAMRGRLAEAKDRQQRLMLRIEGHCGAIRSGLNTALTPVADLEIPRLATFMDDLVQHWGELQAVRGEIARLEKELF